MSKFFTRQRLTIALSHSASIYAQRVNFLRAHCVPRWDGPKWTNRLEIVFGLVLLGKVAKESLTGPLKCNDRPPFRCCPIIGFSRSTVSLKIKVFIGF